MENAKYYTCGYLEFEEFYPLCFRVRITEEGMKMIGTPVFLEIRKDIYQADEVFGTLESNKDAFELSMPPDAVDVEIEEGYSGDADTLTPESVIAVVYGSIGSVMTRTEYENWLKERK